MKTNEIATVQDILNLESQIKKMYQKLEEKIIKSNDDNYNGEEYLRSKGVKQLLGVSDNKLRTMREDGEVPYSFIGSTYYYSKKEILGILESNTINKTK